MVSSRKTLRVLQPAADNQSLLVGGDGVIRLGKQELSPGIRKKASETPPSESAPEKADSKMPARRDRGQKENEKVRPRSKSTPLRKVAEKADKETNTGDLNGIGCCCPMDSVSPQEILQWMTSKEAPENYWRTLAEQRRLALQETLKENQELHARNDSLLKEIQLLKDTNEALQEMAEHGERLADILQELENATE